MNYLMTKILNQQSKILKIYFKSLSSHTCKYYVICRKQYQGNFNDFKTFFFKKESLEAEEAIKTVKIEEEFD